MALPPLVRRVCHEKLSRFDVDIYEPPFRIKRGRFAEKFDDFDNALLFLASACDVILVVLDADDDCPVDLAAGLRVRGKNAIGHKQVEVVVAQKEFECWLLAAVDSLRGFRGVAEDAECPANVEDIRGAKGRLESMMKSGVYSETVDQVKFACQIDLDTASRNARSFRKLSGSSGLRV
jgi:hypothetical protein